MASSTALTAENSRCRAQSSGSGVCSIRVSSSGTIRGKDCDTYGGQPAKSLAQMFPIVDGREIVQDFGDRQQWYRGGER
jgi:hypothetical protein